MSKKQINCLLVFNTDDQFLSANAKSRVFKECVPIGTCPQEIYQLCTRDISTVVEFTEKRPIDLIIQYGLGNGLLWESDSFREIKCLNDDHTFQELVGSEDVIHKQFHPVIAKEYADLDSKKSWPDRVMIAKTKADLKYIVDRCRKESYGLDTETNHFNSFIRNPEPFLVGFSVAWNSDEEECWWISTCQNHITAGEAEFTLEEALECARTVFFDCNQWCDWQNAHYDQIVLWELFGQKQKKFRCDTMLLFSLYHKAMASAALSENVQMLGLPVYKDAAKDWLRSQPKRKKGQAPLTFADVPLEIIAPYGALDALAVARATNFMRKNLSQEQWQFYYQVAHEVLLASIDLCIDGYEISRDRYNYTKLTAEKEIIKAYAECINVVKDKVDAQFNIGSNQQLANLLFDKLGLPSLQKTEGGAQACGAKVLDDLILFHPFIFYLLKVKKLAKLYSSYVLGYTNVLGPGTRWVKTNSRYIINAQLRQINRTARLGASNMNGHLGTNKKGGNILVLPGTGSMIKHYFGPREVLSLENELYDGILGKLAIDDPEKCAEVMEALSQNATKVIKPEKPVKPKKEKKEKIPKTPKAKKGKVDTVIEDGNEDTEGVIVSLDEIDQEELINEDELPWD